MIAQATTRPQITAENLNAMRLPELWAIFAQVTGESSRCPNRNFLVRRILEASHNNQPLAAPRPTFEAAVAADDLDAALDAALDTGEDEDQIQPFPGDASNASDEDLDEEVEDEDETDDANADEDADEDEDEDEEIDPEAFADEEAQDLAYAEAAQPGEAFLNHGEGPDEQDPNAIHVANEQAHVEPCDKPTPQGESVTEADAMEAKRKIPRGAPIEALQARYLEVVGKPTTSTHRTYLLWKIKQVERGLITPRLRPVSAPVDADKFQVLPIRLPISTVEQMDEACERLGLANRMVLFRRALRTFFFSAGEPQVARLFERTV